MLSTAAIAMWWSIAPEMQAEFEDWHTSEHMPERLAIPGFLRGTRWIALSGEPSYFVLYEAQELATITSGPYLARLNDPTPWSRRMMPQHRNMVRSLCLVRSGFGDGLPHALATVRCAKEVNLSALPRRKGVTCARILEAQPTPGAQTTEQKIRGGDATADWVLLVGGYDAGAVKAVAGETAPPGAKVDYFRVAYSLTSRDTP